MSDALDDDVRREAWEIIARVRDAHPRSAHDASTEEIVEALEAADLLQRPNYMRAQ